MAEGVVSIGERLRRHRESLGLSQAQVARELDVARTAYRLWEMEAAKPSPDRWRLISRWLGVSVATLMVAEGLADQDEAEQADVITGRFGPLSWGDEAGRVGGDIFDQERAMIARAGRDGRLNETETGELTGLMERAERVVAGRLAGERSSERASAELRKELSADRAAPGIARAAVVVAAAGVAEQALLDAELLTSDLVSNSVLQAREAAQISLRITVTDDLLRVAVGEPLSQGEPGRSDPGTGRDVTLVTALATRWGGARTGDEYVTWFEIDLAPPFA